MKSILTFLLFSLNKLRLYKVILKHLSQFKTQITEIFLFKYVKSVTLTTALTNFFIHELENNSFN